MKCPVCDGRLEVTDTRSTDAVVTRKRECIECLTQFNTTEKINYQQLSRYVLNLIHDKVEGGAR